ncbi:MAG TPA: hypothetical protein VKZ89_05830 [Thermobifida alba]|nr:hypothetical protein [Thermobifida alba]
MTSRRFVRPPRPGSGGDARLDSCAEEIRGELRRADTKASMLLAVSGAAAALVGSSDLLTAPHALTAWPARAGAALLVAAVVALLLTVRPKTAGAPFMQDPAAWRPDPPRGGAVVTPTTYTATFAAAVLALGATVALLIHPAVLVLLGAAVPIAYTDLGAALGLWAPMTVNDLLDAEEATNR